MSRFVDGISSLFNGPDTSEQQAEIARQRDAQSVALTRQQQEAQTESNRQDQQLGKTARAAPGRRLLLAATGEQGLSGKLG